MATWFFVSDLHGHADRYEKLFRLILSELPRVVLMGGDLLPSVYEQEAGVGAEGRGFVADLLEVKLATIKEDLGDDAPEILLILGNDDGRLAEPDLAAGEEGGIWHYVQGKSVEVDGYPVFGYSYVPPTPFQLKDWERYDVSRFVDPGCIPPEEGGRTVPVVIEEERFATISGDLEQLAGGDALERAIFLFHAPPHRSKLDRAALDGVVVDHVPLDVHVGSIAIQRFIADRQPLLTLHGHVHESARLTGSWRDLFGRTHSFSAAHDGPELALVRFDPTQLEAATRELV